MLRHKRELNGPHNPMGGFLLNSAGVFLFASCTYILTPTSGGMMKRMLLILICLTIFLPAQSNPVGKWEIDTEWVENVIASSIEGDSESEINKMTAKMVRDQFAEQSMEFKGNGTMIDPRGGEAKWKKKGKKILAKPPGSDEWIEALFGIIEGTLYVGTGTLNERMPFKKVKPEKKIRKK